MDTNLYLLKKFTSIMDYSNRRMAGVLFFVAAAQFILGLIVAEALYPGYNISKNYISDLGVGPSSMIFNTSVILLGFLSLVGTYFLHRAFNRKTMTLLLTVAALGAMGVGIFTEDSGLMHVFVSFLVFFFGELSAIFSYRLMKHPFSIIVIVLGLTSLIALILFTGNSYFGLGVGGMERIIVYPILIWMIGFGSFLIASPEKL
jgi:hypothetical membrane protein